MDKNLTIYVPSGMRLDTTHASEATRNLLKRNRSFKSKDISFSEERISFNAKTNNPPKSYSKNDITLDQPKEINTAKHKITPPKVICRNKSITPEKLKIKINEDWVPELGAKSIKNRPEENRVHVFTDSCKNDGALEVNCRNKSVTPTKFNAKRNEDSVPELGSIKKTPEENRVRVVTDSCKNGGTYNTEKIKRISETETINNSREIDDSPKKIVNFKSKIRDQLKLFSKRSHDLKTTEKLKQPSVKCDCEDCDGFLKCPAWCSKNIKFDESSAANVKKALPLLRISNASAKSAKVVTVSTNNIFLHGVIIPKPVDSLDKTYFDKSIKSAIQTMNCISVKNMQSYVWPSVQRGLSVFMVGPPQCGKTLAYLPAFCTFALEKSEKYSELSKYGGPLIVILCPDNKRCEQVHSLASALIKDCWDGATVEIMTDSSTKKNCDILVAIPSVLESCLKSYLVNLKSLCHLALEDADLLLKNYPESAGNIFRVIDEMQANRPHNKSVQVVTCSEKWTLNLETLLARMYTSPLVCFEDYLEAAIYAKTNFRKKKLSSDHKQFYVEDILKKQYATHKTIVFCDESEIGDIFVYLQLKGIECISISNELIEDEIFENEDMWCSLKIGRYKVLLCTDKLFEKTVRIVSANWLVHFSLPSSWEKFEKRFRSLSANLCSPLEVEEDDSVQHTDNYSFLLVDEACKQDLFTNFFSVLSRNLIMNFKL